MSIYSVFKEQDSESETLKTKQSNSLCRFGAVWHLHHSKSDVPSTSKSSILRKEVIQPHLPIRLPCYDFTPIIHPTFGGWLFKVARPTSGVTNSRGVTGGVYKTRERIHRGILIRDY